MNSFLLRISRTRHSNGAAAPRRAPRRHSNGEAAYFEFHEEGIQTAKLHLNRVRQSNQPTKPGALLLYFARSIYSPVFGFTRTFSPVLTTSGTLTVTPFSSLAGFVDAVFVAVFITGAVSTISSTIEFGSWIPITFPL